MAKRTAERKEQHFNEEKAKVWIREAINCGNSSIFGKAKENCGRRSNRLDGNEATVVAILRGQETEQFEDTAGLKQKLLGRCEEERQFCERKATNLEERVQSRFRNEKATIFQKAKEPVSRDRGDIFRNLKEKELQYEIEGRRNCGEKARELSVFGTKEDSFEMKKRQFEEERATV
jgi:hypothetical protein